MEDELARMLDRLPEGIPWRVERVLKESPSEVTQLVFLRAGDGEVGPLVRKVIRLAPGAGEVWQRLFACQGEGLRSRQLPLVLGCSERDGRLEVVMERVPGPTLRQLVAGTPPEGRQALAECVIPSLCDAACELNEGLGEPIVHRDITPSNVICSGTDHHTAVLVDLGIARAWREGRDSDTTHLGTRSYAPPEQFGFGQTDLRCDVYAIGMCALFCLTGRDPTARDRESGFAVKGVPPAWRRVIARACAFDPGERYRSAREMGQALRRLGEPGGPPEAPAVGAAPEGAARPLEPGVVRRLLASAWRARNIVVVPVTVLMVAASTVNVFDLTALLRGNPWVNAFGYLVYMNFIVLAAGYLLMDKTWLKAHVGFLRTHTTGQVARMLAMVFAVLTTALCILTILPLG